MYLSHNWYNLFGYCVLYGFWILDGCVDCIICATNWFIQSSYEFRKWLVYKDFILKDTKLLSNLPWPSRKQSTVFISSNSNLIFLTFSILSAKTEPLVCVVFVFWKELNKCFLNFFLNSLFFAMLGILTTPLSLWLESTARCTLSNICSLFEITFHWIDTSIVYTDSPRVDRWSKMYPTSLVALERFLVVQYEIYKWVKNTSCRRDSRCSSLYKQCNFHMYLQKWRDFFLKFLHKSWGLFVT